MSGILGGEQPTNYTPNYTGLRIQTSVSTLPIPVAWGAVKLAFNLIDYLDFTKKNASGQAGKGGGSGPYDYTASLLVALCEGPVLDVPLNYKSTNVIGPATNEWTIIPGTSPQAPWGYLTANHPSHALGYPGTVLLAKANYDLGGTPDVPAHNFLVYGPLMNTAWWTPAGSLPAPYYQPDRIVRPADLALVIQDFLTNPQYGVPRFPASSIDTATLLSTWVGNTATDGSLQTYLAALGMGYCPLCDSQEKASAILDRWLQLAYCAAVWSGTSLKLIPYADQPISASYTNPFTGQSFTFNYVPNVTPVYDLDDDDFVGDASEDPVIVTRIDPADAHNVVRLEVTTNDGWYDNVPVEARDQSQIELYGLRVAPTIAAHEIVSTYLGGLIAQLLLQRGLYVRNTYRFKLSWEFCLLEPMDLVTLTDPALGLNRTTVRITAIEEDDKGILTVTAEEFPAGIATAALYQRSAPSFSIPNAGETAVPVNPPLILEPGAALVSSAQLWLAASGSGAYWGGCNVWAALASSGPYQEIGTITAAARQGILTASLPLVSGWDTTSTLAVDLSESEGQLLPASQADAQAGRTLCSVDGELIGYANAQLVTATAAAEAQTVPAAAPYLVQAAQAATWSSDGGVAYAAGGSLAAVPPVAIAGEAHAVPASWPYQVTAANAASFITDGGASYAGGGALTLVAGAPAAGQYTVDGGAYGFSAADAGAAIKLAYSCAEPGPGQYTAVAGDYWFNAADAGKAVSLTYSYGSPYHYALTGLQRGMYGTAPASHAGGAQFARLDSAILQVPLPADYVGQTLYLKLVSFNSWGGGLQDIADPAEVATYSYTPQGTYYDFSTSPFMSLLYNGASISLGDPSGGVTATFACGDPSAGIVQALQLQELP